MLAAEPLPRRGHRRAGGGRLRAAARGRRLRGVARRRRACGCTRTGSRTSTSTSEFEGGEPDKVFDEAAGTITPAVHDPAPDRRAARAARDRGDLGPGPLNAVDARELPGRLPGARGDRARVRPAHTTACAITAPDSGGGFGVKLPVYPEELACCCIAMVLDGRWNVKWIQDRQEDLIGTVPGARPGRRHRGRTRRRRPRARNEGEAHLGRRRVRHPRPRQHDGGRARRKGAAGALRHPALLVRARRGDDEQAAHPSLPRRGAPDDDLLHGDADGRGREGDRARPLRGPPAQPGRRVSPPERHGLGARAGQLCRSARPRDGADRLRGLRGAAAEHARAGPLLRDRHLERLRDRRARRHLVRRARCADLEPGGLPDPRRPERQGLTPSSARRARARASRPCWRRWWPTSSACRSPTSRSRWATPTPRRTAAARGGAARRRSAAPPRRWPAGRLREKLLDIAGFMLEASPEDLELAEGSAQVRGVPGSAVTVEDIAKTAYYTSARAPAGDGAGARGDGPLRAGARHPLERRPRSDRRGRSRHWATSRFTAT